MIKIVNGGVDTEITTRVNIDLAELTKSILNVRASTSSIRYISLRRDWTFSDQVQTLNCMVMVKDGKSKPGKPIKNPPSRRRFKETHWAAEDRDRHPFV
jgi:hypothetical protein